MPRYRAMLPLAVALLLAACAPYRLPRHPHSDGSPTNRVVHAYFALRGYPGAWKLRLLIDDELAGAYGFRLDDSAWVGKPR